MNSDNATLHESVNLYRLVERQRTEKALAALAQLGHHLSTATTATEAARVIVEVADELLGWDACSFDLYSEETRTTAPILNMDVVAGQRTAVPPAYPGASLAPTMQRVLTEGGQLILREETDAAADDLLPFGDTGRPSASLMFVAIRSRQRVVGILSIQSYIPHAYDRESLALLQALADHCGGALERIQAEAAEREQRHLAEALRDTAAALSGTLDFDQILDRILIEVGRVVPHDTANVMLIAGNHASIARERGYAERHLPPPPLDLRLPVDDTPTLHEMAATGRPCIVSDTQTYPGWVHRHENRWIRSYAGAPIRSRGQTLGFLNLNSSTPGFFTPAHTERLQAFADQAGMALENARLLTETQRHARELAVLYETAIATTGTLETDALLAEMSRQVRRLIAVDSLFVALYDPKEEECRLVFVISDDEAVRDAMVGLRLPVAGAGLIAWVARTGQTLHVGDVQSDPLPAPPIQVGPKTKRAWLGVPLIAHNRLIGVISVQSNRPHAFSEEDRRLLEALAAPIAIAIANARLYEEVQRHANELEQRVAERTAALQEANEKLKELDRFKSQFISDVSHELRTPLTNTRLILDLLVKGRPEKRDQYIATLRRETSMLSALIEDLLYLSRMDLGKVQPKLEPVDLSQLAATLASDRAALFAERGHMLRTDLAAGLPPVSADPKMLTQVLTNLLANAMNYTPAGGTISISATLQRDAGGKMKADRCGREWIALAVSDTGPGIAADEQARLFERFYRGETGRRSGAAGTGLGLAICQEIVARHGGQITVESQIGQGSTFTVWLPVPDRV